MDSFQDSDWPVQMCLSTNQNARRAVPKMAVSNHVTSMCGSAGAVHDMTLPRPKVPSVATIVAATCGHNFVRVIFLYC